jgi:4-hydroxybenzoate polyprenyltransferase
MPPGLLSPAALSRRLLTVLQLTRMALVFTAIADSQCELLISYAAKGQWPPTKLILLLVLISAGLYGFGMSLNDITDRRRDAQLAATRPLPSGRIGIVPAHVVCIGLVIMALVAGWFFSQARGPHGWVALAIIVVVGGMISFYDLAGKYLVGPGLVSLGLIRFFHAIIAEPKMAVVWHPIFLLTHVTIISMLAYDWEDKRPQLTKAHWWGVLGAVAAIDLLALSGVAVANHHRGISRPVIAALNITPWLMLPVAAAIVFAMAVWFIRKTAPSRRAAGQRLMLYGLLWLIVYDAAFAAAYGVNAWAGAALLLLLPIAYFSVQCMRWWSKLLTISQRPHFIVAGAGEPHRHTDRRG